MIQDNPGFKQLVEAYTADDSDDSLALFLGAGINLPTRDVKQQHFDTYSWEGLLRAIYDRNMIQYSRSFEELKRKYRNDWPGLAEALIENMGVEKLVSEIDLIFYHCLPRGDRYGRLSKRMLDQAPGLRAAISFTTRLKGQRTFERNPKIGMVITPNYDFFFGAGWTRYQAFPGLWKVQTPFSEEKPSPTQHAINYIHGYIPYRLNYRKELVLTRASFEEAYQRGGFARCVLEEAVHKHHLLFIGTSFSDPPVVKILRQARGQRNARLHFSIEKTPDAERLGKLEHMGVVPVLIEDYSGVSQVLQELYCMGLECSRWERYGMSSKAYWQRLQQGPR